MKEIKAIVQPFMLSHVLDALHNIGGLPGVTVAEVRSIDLARGRFEQVTKIKLEIIVSDEQVLDVVRTIQTHAHTGKAGDGRVFVIDVQHTVIIRTGEHDVS